MCSYCMLPYKLDAHYLTNLMLTAVLNGLSLYKKLMKIKPKIDHLRVFGCLCYSKVLPTTDKFDSRSIPSVMMGYSLTQKGYKLFNLETNTFIVSRDIKFIKNTFPLKHNNS